MAKLPQDFTDLLVELCEAKAELLLVGGWAVILYGHVRATDDMGIFVRQSVTNSERVFAALEAFGAPCERMPFRQRTSQGKGTPTALVSRR